jgi:hypothetical protein
VAWSARKLVIRWESTAVSIEPVSTSLALLAMCAASLLISIAWAIQIRMMTRTAPPYSRLLSIYATSSLGKYVPGKVGQPVMRMAGLAPYGYDGRTTAASIVIEIFSWGATGVAVAAGLLLLGSESAWEFRFHAFAGAVLALIALVVVTITKANRYPKFLQAPDITQDAPLLPGRVVLLHVASWCLWAAHGALLCRAVGLNTLPETMRASAFTVLAPIAGFLALPVPAGVGVRESFMSLGLATSVGAQSALTAALLSRGASLAADILLWIAFSRVRPPGKDNTQTP